MRRPAVAVKPPPPPQLGILPENGRSDRRGVDDRGAVLGESIATVGAVVKVELERHGTL